MNEVLHKSASNPAEFGDQEVVDGLRFALVNGAAKLSSVLNDEDLAPLSGGAYDGRYILNRSAGLNRILSQIIGGSPGWGMDMTLGVLPAEVVGGFGEELIHQDSITRRGLAILVPVTENKGTFGADNAPFQEDDYLWPRVLFTYGRGDAVIVREDVSARNGLALQPGFPTDHPDTQAYHFGASARPRKLWIFSLGLVAEESRIIRRVAENNLV